MLKYDLALVMFVLVCGCDNVDSAGMVNNVPGGDLRVSATVMTGIDRGWIGWTLQDPTKCQLVFI